MSERNLMLELMRTIVNGIVSVEAVAGHVAEVAVELDADGQRDAADVLRMLARNHRVRSLELRGQLAIVSGCYVELIQNDVGEA